MMEPNGASAADHENKRKRRKRSAEEIVRSLQMRIAKAQQQGRSSKVKALQHLLTHSQSGRITAVQRVTGNSGRNTPGVDGQT